MIVENLPVGVKINESTRNVKKLGDPQLTKKSGRGKLASVWSKSLNQQYLHEPAVILKVWQQDGFPPGLGDLPMRQNSRKLKPTHQGL